MLASTCTWVQVCKWEWTKTLLFTNKIVVHAYKASHFILLHYYSNFAKCFPRILVYQPYLPPLPRAWAATDCYWAPLEARRTLSLQPGSRGWRVGRKACSRGAAKPSYLYLVLSSRAHISGKGKMPRTLQWDFILPTHQYQHISPAWVLQGLVRWKGAE